MIECQDYPKVTKCKLVTLNLRIMLIYVGRIWKHNAQEKGKIRLEIGDLKRLMQKRFVLEYYKQWGMCVEDYIKEFELLMIRC